jgi:hypothetical protein
VENTVRLFVILNSFAVTGGGAFEVEHLELELLPLSVNWLVSSFLKLSRSSGQLYFQGISLILFTVAQQVDPLGRIVVLRSDAGSALLQVVFFTQLRTFSFLICYVCNI